MSDVAVIKAETALLQNGLNEAEAILLQAGLPTQAITINLQMFQFEKSAQLAKFILRFPRLFYDFNTCFFVFR